MINIKGYSYVTSALRFIKSFSTYFTAKVMEQMAPFLLLPVLTRFLTPNDYGIWATFMAISGIVTVVIGMGTVNAIVRAYIDRDKKEFCFPEYTTNALYINVVAFTAVFFVFFMIRSFVSEKLGIPGPWLLFIPVIGLCLTMYNIPFRLYVFKRRPLPYAAFKFSHTLIELLFSIFLVVYIGLGWRGRVLGMTGNRVIFFILGIVLIYKSDLSRFVFRKDYCRDIFRYGTPMVIEGLGVAIIVATDRIFLNRMVGLSATGLYSVAYSIATIVFFVNMAFYLTWQPIFLEKLRSATSEVKKRLVGYAYIFFILISLVALAVIFAAPYFVRIFMGQKFYGASQFILWLVLANAVHGMYVIVKAPILFKKDTYLLTKISVITVLSNIVFNYVFIRSFGAVGAAQATCLTFLVRFIVTWYLSNKAYYMPWFTFYKRS